MAILFRKNTKIASRWKLSSLFPKASGGPDPAYGTLELYQFAQNAA